MAKLFIKKKKISESSHLVPTPMSINVVKPLSGTPSVCLLEALIAYPTINMHNQHPQLAHKIEKLFSLFNICKLVNIVDLRVDLFSWMHSLSYENESLGCWAYFTWIETSVSDQNLMNI